jgi:Flp pilus assembly protein CpaB
MLRARGEGDGVIRTVGLGRVVRRHRRVLAASCSAAAMLTLGLALRPPEPATVEVVVAARDLPTGHRLAAEDLGRAAVPTGVSLPGALPAPEPLIGQVLAAPLVRGEAVLPARLMAHPAWALRGAPGPGLVPLPVRFADAAAARLLTAGQRVDVLAAEGPLPDGLEAAPGVPRALVLARGATVLAIAEPGGDDGGLLGEGDMEAAGGPLVVLGLTEPQALAVAGAAASRQLSFTLASTGTGAIPEPGQP